LSLERAGATLGTAEFWLNTDRPPLDALLLWVGAATKDTGFSLTKLTFQITHATDPDTNIERDYILDELKKNGAIREANLYPARETLSVAKVNRYVTDGEVLVASLAASLQAD
jgi:hypothetical protein